MSGVPPQPGAAPPNMTVQQMQQVQQMMAQQQQQQMAAAAAVASGGPATATQAPQAPTSGQPAVAPVASARTAQPAQDLGNLPIRAYLDQTVVPILLDGKEIKSVVMDSLCYYLLCETVVADWMIALLLKFLSL